MLPRSPCIQVMEIVVSAPEKRLKERLKKLAELHKRSVNKEVLYLLERTLKLEEEKLKAG